MNRSSKKLPGAFVSDVWTATLIEASLTEPAVLHAVLALSSAHRKEVLDARNQASQEAPHQEMLTLQQYSKAIRYLQPHFTDRNSVSIRLALIPCAFFIYLEFLRGSYMTGITHLQHGLNLIQDLQRLTGKGCGFWGESTSNVADWTITIFTRLLVQAKLLGQDVRSPYHTFVLREPSANTTIFHSIHQARQILEHLLLRIFDLQEQSIRRDMLPAANLSSKLRDCQRRIQNELQGWFNAHEATLDCVSPTLGSSEVAAYRLLHLYHTMATIMADTCVVPQDESDFDRHVSQFSSIVSRCAKSHQVMLVSDGTISAWNGNRDPDSLSSMSISDMG